MWTGVHSRTTTYVETVMLAAPLELLCYRIEFAKVVCKTANFRFTSRVMNCYSIKLLHARFMSFSWKLKRAKTFRSDLCNAYKQHYKQRNGQLSF